MKERRILSTVFLWGGVAKFFLLVISLLILRYFDAEEYSLFIFVFSMHNYIYQGVCGVYERLFIVERKYNEDKYKVNILVLFLLSVFLVCIFSLIAKVGVNTFLALILLVTSSYFYQIKRIQYQAAGSFGQYCKIDVVRSMTWFFLVVLFVCLDLNDSFVLLLLMSFSLIVMVRAGIIDVFREKYQWIEIRSAAFYYCSKFYIIIYSIMTALIPGLPLLYAEIIGDAETVGSVGAALRYQAILSLMVLSLNSVCLSRLASHGSKGFDWRILFPVTVLSVVFVLIVGASIPWMNNGKYLDSKTYFYVFGACSLVSMLSVYAVNFIVAQRKYKFMAWNYIRACVLGLSVFVVVESHVDAVASSKVMLSIFSLFIVYIANSLGNIFFCYKCGKV